MSQQFVPPTRAPLIDGRDLRVEADGVHVGEQFYPLTQIQEARMLFLRPETIALTLASVGQVEYSFARPGDGVAALEALYRLRPETRRPDAPAPALDAPAGYLASVAPPPAQPQPSMPYAPTALPGGQPGAPFGAPHTGYPPAPYPSYAPYAPYPPRQMAPVPFPPPVVEAYGPSPNRTHAGLTPAPRAAGQLIGSTFHLFGKRLGPLLALALVVAALPSAAIALLDSLVSALSGVNPLAGAPNPLDTLQQMVNGQTPATTAPATTAATPLDTTIGLLSLIAVVLTLLVAAWTQAALTVGAREVTLGRRLSIRACAREGLTRLWPTLWALFFLYGVLAIIAIPGLGLALAFVLGPSEPGAGAQVTPADALALAIMAGVITAITLMIVAYLWSRFALYPTAAALGLPQPLRVAFTLTAFGWWRVFSALLVVTLVTLALTLSASAAQLLSVAVAAVLLAPLAQLIAGPLGALIRVGVLYDQRLRREGYALFQQEGIAPPADASAQPTPEHPTEVSR
ncbi:MAG TPA: hypothetical protein VFU60_04710 [Ktedonobacterales bacterium]|nr:hypothetical protein [Ktedonobacterales bacterium]